MKPSRRKILQSAGCLALAAALGPACTRRTIEPRVVVPFWFSYGGRNRQTLEALVARFNASQAHVLVQATFQGDYFEALAKLRTAIAAQAAPAITHVVSEVVPYLAEAGVLETLDGYPHAHDLDLVPALAQPGTWVGGERRPLIALPFNRSTPILYVNQDMLRSQGVGLPSTWKELRDAARRLTSRNRDRVTRWGFECPIAWWFWVALVGQAGGSLMAPDGTPSLGGEEGVRALEFWQQLVHDDRTMRPPPGRDYNAWEVTNQDFLAKRVAMICSSTAFVRYLEDNAAFPVMAGPMPGDLQKAVPTGGTFFVMMKHAADEQKRAAWEFLRWMVQPAQTIEWATSTGYMPVARQAVRQLESEGYYQRHPNDRVAMDQLAYAQPWPWAPGLFRIERECVDPLIEEAVLVPRNARDVLAEARRRAADD